MTILSLLKALHDSSQHLDEATQRYLEHAQALETAVEDNAFGRSALDELFAEIPTEQASARLKCDKLKKASAVLNRVYNQSTAFVPIRSLPGDVLVHIFALACNKRRFFPTTERPISKCRITRTMLAVTHVCTDWRRLAINTPILWTHVDIIDNGPRNRPGYEMMWLERAGSAPLSVQVAIQHYVRGDYTKGALNRLVPHFSTVRSLGLHADSCHALEAALVYWMSNGTPGSVRELLLTGCARPPGPFDVNSVAFMDHLPLEPAVISSFLAPIRILRLQHVSMSLFSEICRGLLHLEPSQSTPSEVHLTMLTLPLLPSISLGLRVLQLEKSQIGSIQDFQHRGALKLDALERLELADLFPDPCSTLLPLLNPGPGELSLRLSAPTKPSDEEAVRSFLSRSNVTKLFIKVYPYDSLATVDCFAAITDLRVLAVHFNGCDFHECTSLLRALLPLPGSSSTCQWPRLHGLWLIGGGCEDDALKDILRAYHIQTVILSTMWSPDTRSTQEQMQALVKEVIIEDDEESLSQWYTKC